MTPEERITQLEARLAAAEGRIMALEARVAPLSAIPFPGYGPPQHPMPKIFPVIVTHPEGETPAMSPARRWMVTS